MRSRITATLGVFLVSVFALGALLSCGPNAGGTNASNAEPSNVAKAAAGEIDESSIVRT